MNNFEYFKGKTEFKNVKDYTIDLLNSEYESIKFSFNNQDYAYRFAKKTPIKEGYFLAHYWKDENGINQPYDSDYNRNLIIFIKDEENEGYFNFDMDFLISSGILRSPSKNGKMAFRIYPPWSKNLNSTAAKTQKQQVPYFVQLAE